MSLDDFLLGTYDTALEPGELLTEVQVPPLPEGWSSAFMRIERFYRPTVNAAVAVLRRNGHVEDVRLAVGCVGPRALRLSELEEKLRGLGIDEVRRVIADAKPYLTERLDPIGDLLGSADYKIYVTSVLLARAVEQATGSNGRQVHD
jgi:CO/xanthine dehydrogenase FAD-binding subunit